MTAARATTACHTVFQASLNRVNCIQLCINFGFRAASLIYSPPFQSTAWRTNDNYKLTRPRLGNNQLSWAANTILRNGNNTRPPAFHLQTHIRPMKHLGKHATLSRSVQRGKGQVTVSWRVPGGGLRARHVSTIELHCFHEQYNELSRHICM